MELKRNSGTRFNTALPRAGDAKPYHVGGAKSHPWDASGTPPGSPDYASLHPGYGIQATGRDPRRCRGRTNPDRIPSEQGISQGIFETYFTDRFLLLALLAEKDQEVDSGEFKTATPQMSQHKYMIIEYIVNDFIALRVMRG
jgi:hypothetical protein